MQTYLEFSDTAKYADIARNLINGLGYGSNFNFWGESVFDLIKNNLFPYPWAPPVLPYSIAIAFKIFGESDLAVIATSIFYFLLTLPLVYLLAKKIFNNRLTGVLSTIAVGFNYDLIHYAKSGASESPFISEIVAGLYFVTLKKKWANILTIFILVLLYFTRTQSFIYIAGIIFYWLLVNFKLKKAILYFVGVLFGGILIDYFILYPLSGKYYLYSIIFRILTSGYNQSPVASDALRGAVSSSIGILPILKNVFYNLYNFYKLLPQIINPYLFTIFVIGLFKWSPDRSINSFKIASIFMVLLTLLVTAASIPFFRYLHPVIPLIYILAVGTMVSIISNNEILISKQIQILKFKISKDLFVILTSLFLILFLGVGQTLGVLLLDSRFVAKSHNIGKPPVYVELARILNENTKPTDVVITNLDTWGSWYGERKTVWFPLSPKQLIDPATGQIPFDAIYLTSYLIDDPNYYMGESWRQIYENPKNPEKWDCEGCDAISKEFVLNGVYKIEPSEDYEREGATGILLIRK